eukprot:116177_1
MRCNRGLVSASLYFIGCAQLIPASILILPSFPINELYFGKLYLGNHVELGIIFYISACSFFTIVGIFDFIFETHICLKSRKNSEEIIDPFIKSFETDIKQQQNISNINQYNILSWWITFFYLIGGMLFLFGSVGYYPTLDNIEIFNISIISLANWIWAFGSMNYIFGSVTSLYKMKINNNNSKVSQKTNKLLIPNDDKNILEVSITDIGTDTILNDFETEVCSKKACINSECMWRSLLWMYIIGALLFITGCTLFEIEQNGGELSWLLGSIFFCLGSIFGCIETLRQNKVMK